MSEIREQLDKLRSNVADYTIGALIAVMQMKMARRRGHFVTPIIFGDKAEPKAEPDVVTRPTEIVREVERQCDSAGSG